MQRVRADFLEKGRKHAQADDSGCAMGPLQPQPAFQRMETLLRRRGAVGMANDFQERFLPAGKASMSFQVVRAGARHILQTGFVQCAIPRRTRRLFRARSA